MSLQFIIPQPLSKVTTQTLAKGFGLPLVQRALIGSLERPEKDKPEYFSRFGTPIYGAFRLLKPKPETWYSYEYNAQTKKYLKTDEGAKLQDGSDGNGILFEGAILEVNQQKNIVTTQVAGFDGGSIKEFINNGDYIITLRCYLDSYEADVYPKNDVEVLLSYLKAPINFKYENTFLSMILPAGFDLVVSGYNMFQQQGLRNIQYFEINFISDGDFEIIKE
jgi:hypothetical protein